MDVVITEAWSSSQSKENSLNSGTAVSRRFKIQNCLLRSGGIGIAEESAHYTSFRIMETFRYLYKNI